MLFNSESFLIFFPVVTSLFFLLRGTSRLVMLLAASIFFYAVFIPKFIVILFFLIAVDYVAGRLIEPALGGKRRWLLIMSLVANLGVLATFKYFDFFSANLGAFLSFLHINYQPKALSLILPIGLSFHTFQSMSYTIEVYRGRQKAEKNLLIYALYVLFYPQLVAGPIERPQNLLHQFRELKDFDFERLVSGLELMAWGFFKKVFVADRLAVFANEVFNSSGNGHSSLSILLGVYFFTFQIFCDFSGYTDIARGAARVMGFHLMENFKNPYGAQNVPEFWHRWHISLSSWFRDYLYIPLGGNRTTTPVWIFNIMMVFLLSGLWHGANWTFVVWGALHGLFVVATRFSVKIVPSIQRAPAWLKRFVTFNLVSLAWIFFRAKTLASATSVLSGMFQGVHLSAFIHETILNEAACTGILCLVVFGVFARIRSEHPWVPSWRLAFWFAAIVQAIIIGAPLNETAFIYFQF